MKQAWVKKPAPLTVAFDLPVSPSRIETSVILESMPS